MPRPLLAVFSLAAIVTALLSPRPVYAQGAAVLIDPAEPAASWQAIASDGVQVAIDPGGDEGRALRISYDFTAGSGFCIVRRPVDLVLGENYRFAFRVRGDGPANDLEFKLVDPSGDSVWWVNRRAFEAPPGWLPISYKRRHFEFAWGPLAGEPMPRVGFIEIAIAASKGGSGTIEIDALTFEPLPPDAPYTGTPMLLDMDTPRASPVPIKNGRPDWEFSHTRRTLGIDFGQLRPITGLRLEWSSPQAPFSYTIESAGSTGQLTRIGAVVDSDGAADTVILPEIETRRLRIAVDGPSPVTLEGFEVITPEVATGPNAMLERMASELPRSSMPRSMHNIQTAWTIVGTPSHPSEAILSELGAVEFDKAGFSIEPFLLQDSTLLGWAEGHHEQSLEAAMLPLPTVRRTHDGITLDVSPVATGNERTAHAITRYRITNTSDTPWSGRLVLAIRPIQVLPPWQWLNVRGGFAPIRSIEIDGPDAMINTDRPLRSWTQPTHSAVWDMQAAPLPTGWEIGSVSISKSNATGTLVGAWASDLDLASGQHRDIIIEAPLRGDEGFPSLLTPSDGDPAQRYADLRRHEAVAWMQRLELVDLRLPDHAVELERSIRSTIAFILINRDGPAIQPGSRTYERAWIRDGSITGAALLSMGHTEEIRDYLAWYAPFQYDSGKVPCVVDHRGPDPVDEHDSTGQLIFAMARYAGVTGDHSFLVEQFEHVDRGIAYLESLIAQRSTPEFAGTAYEGLVPESISHEGYSAKPMHSYWDNFFVLQGIRDAAWIAEIIGRTDRADEWRALAKTFAESLNRSIRLAALEQGVNYIPGCVELGDFDPTSTAVAIAPLSVSDALPQDLLRSTLDDYWAWFEARRLGTREWRDYTPYEMRVIGAMALSGRRDKAKAMTDWFMTQRTPIGWNQWPEVVYRDPGYPGFIGDMPHTWCGAGLVNSFVASAITRVGGEVVVAAGLPLDWFTAPEGFRISGLRTDSGTLDLAVESTDERCDIRLTITTAPGHPPRRIVLDLPDGLTTMRTVTVNGDPVGGDDRIPIDAG